MRRPDRSLIGRVLLALLMLGGSPAAVRAQVASSDAYTPYGSPLSSTGQTTATTGSNGSTYGSGDQTTNSSGTLQSTRITPDEINSSTNDNSNDNDSNTTANSANGASNNSGERNQRSSDVTAREPVLKRPAPPSEFERYAEHVVGRKLPRFGAELLIPGSRDFAMPATATVPPAYVLNPGDEISIGITGSLEGTVDAEIDSDGRIFLPHVGAIKLAGVSYAELRGVLAKAIGAQYRDFNVTATISRLRGIRVYVTGFANNPGAYTVNSLSSLVNALFAAGGPAAGGSFRSVKLYRSGALVSDFDLYDLLRNGDKSKDAVLQNEDVLFVPPVGPQLAISGSVNAEAIYEARPGETLETLLRDAGGANVLADHSRLILYRLADLDGVGGTEVSKAQIASMPAEGGDVIQVLSVGTLERPLERQAVLVRIEGEVDRPGNYYVPANSSLEQVLALAGGLTSRAFVYGTHFERKSVREQQREGFKEAIDQLEISLAAAPLTGDQTIDAGTRASQMLAARATLARLRQAEPDGRVVLDLPPSANALPGTLPLENNDRIYVPPRPTTVGVFGAVYRPASFLIGNGKPQTIRSYLDMAGGPLRAGDRSEIFVVRANGAVLSRHNGALGAPALPGDLIFVPVRTERSSILAKILQLSGIIFQLGLSAATVVAVTN